MKKLIIFITTLLNSFLFGCGFYPYGEDVRFHFLNPNLFGFQGYQSFYYSSLSFGNTMYYPENNQSDGKNEELWKKYCGNKVSVSDIHQVLMHYTASQIDTNDNNSFVKYLYQRKDNEAINYLKFAKSCEYFNTWVDDPWERNENTVVVNRKKLISKAIFLSENSKSNELGKRYAFLALRMALYNHDFKMMNNIYHQKFSIEKQDDIVDVWALYFKAISEENKALSNVYFAKVFEECPEKRFVSWQFFESKIPQKKVLELAKSNEEKSQVLTLYGVSNPGKNLNNLKQIYSYNSYSEGVSFLLAREINKLEDWIFTPYYTLFDSSISYENDFINDDFESKSVAKVLKRSEFDRNYAAEVLRFINSVDVTKVENPEFWKFAKAELLFMNRRFDESLTEIYQLENKLSPHAKMRENIEQIKALNLIAKQKKGEAEIPQQTKNIILKYRNNKRFIFALGRELEYLGNTDDAALLYASLDRPRSENDYYENNFVYYKSKKNSKQTYDDYFYDAFNYIDAVYTPEQLSSFIEKAKKLDDKKDNFSRYFSLKVSSLQGLLDLLATKYLRQNKLDLALDNFKKLGADYYTSKYSPWEKEGAGVYNVAVFNENPFNKLKYTPSFVSEKESFRLNKISIVEKLNEYLKKAENPKEKDRDYYYFLVANCYYNMSQYGNVWMMKRYFLGSRNFSVREDNEEFNTTNLAGMYYSKAFQFAKTKKFKALCLRMQGRCENNRLDFLQEQNDEYFYKDSIYIESRLAKNKFYQKLLKEYPKEYDDLMSNCDFFQSYFKARR